MKVFFTSDTHFGHANIIKYCDRPFSSVEEMNSGLIDAWNAVVSKGDTVYHLGDFAFTPVSEAVALRHRLNGEIHLIAGNHDESKLKHQEFKDLFASVSTIKEVKIKSRGESVRFVLCHYAMRVWNKSHHGSIHLYGHSHGSLPEDPNSRSMDVGVDTNNLYAPYSSDDVLVHMYKKIYKPVDHHDGKRE